jgi:hypothetical protein
MQETQVAQNSFNRPKDTEDTKSKASTSLNAAVNISFITDLATSFTTGTLNIWGTINQVAEKIFSFKKSENKFLSKILNSWPAKIFDRALNIIGSPAAKRILRISLATTGFIAAGAASGGVMPAIILGTTVGLTAFSSIKQFLFKYRTSKRKEMADATATLKSSHYSAKTYIDNLHLSESQKLLINKFIYPEESLRSQKGEKMPLFERFLKRVLPKSISEKITKNKYLMILPATFVDNATQCIGAFFSADFHELFSTMTIGLASENKESTERYLFSRKLGNTIREDLAECGLADKTFKSVREVELANEKQKFFCSRIEKILSDPNFKLKSGEEQKEIITTTIQSTEKDFEHFKLSEKIRMDEEAKHDSFLSKTSKIIYKISNAEFAKIGKSFLSTWNPFATSKKLSDIEEEIYNSRESLKTKIEIETKRIADTTVSFSDLHKRKFQYQNQLGHNKSCVGKLMEERRRNQSQKIEK